MTRHVHYDGRVSEQFRLATLHIARLVMCTRVVIQQLVQLPIVKKSINVQIPFEIRNVGITVSPLKIIDSLEFWLLRTLFAFQIIKSEEKKQNLAV